MTKRIEVAKAPAPLEEYLKHFDPVFGRSNQRESFRQYVEGLLLPSERNKTLTGLVNTEPIVGAHLPRAQKLQWFLSESDWDEQGVQAVRLKLLREERATAPNAQGVLVIDETGDRKDGHKTAHVGRQYLGNVGKIDNGVVSVTSLWADSQVYYPLEVQPYTPEGYFEKGRNDPAFRTKLKMALQLVQQAVEEGWPFRAVVADNFYGEDRGLKSELRKLGVPYVMALKPSHAWYHPEGVAGTLQDVAQEAGWQSAEQQGKWVPITRAFRDGSTQDWWAVEIVAGPYGAGKRERAVVATTDPVTLPDLSTWYLVTNLPAEAVTGTKEPFPPASLEEVIRLYGLRQWVEQSYKQIKYTLGWSEYQVRSDRAIRRHWQLVSCAFSFCWYHQNHPVESSTSPQSPDALPELTPATSGPAVVAGVGKKNQYPSRRATVDFLACSTASGTGMVGALGYAQTLLERVVSTAPTACHAHATSVA